MADGHRVYPVDKFIFHHAVTPDWANTSDKFLIDWYSDNGKQRAYQGGAINPRHTKPGSSELSYAQAHATIRPYTKDGNKYGWRWTWLISDPYNNVTWGAGNWPVNQTAINLEVCGNYLDKVLPDKALMLVADTMRGHDQAIKGILKVYGHRQVSQTGTQCPGRIQEQLDKFVDMLNNPAKWNAILWPAPKPAPTPTPAPAPVTRTINKYPNGRIDLYLVKGEKANLWNTLFTTWSEAKAVTAVNRTKPDGSLTVIEIAGEIKHPIGATYLVTKSSADRNVPNGFNAADLTPYTPPKPVEQPKEPTPAPVEPKPTPTEPTPTPPQNDQPTPTDLEQNAEIGALKAAVGGLITLLLSIGQALVDGLKNLKK